MNDITNAVARTRTLYAGARPTFVAGSDSWPTSTTGAASPCANLGLRHESARSTGVDAVFTAVGVTTIKAGGKTGLGGAAPMHTPVTQQDRPPRGEPR